MEIEKVQSVLQDAGIEVDIKTLQNPTEEFMIQLVTDYLKKFHFDGDEIAKPTPEQLGRISDDESIIVDAIKAINLHAALSTICDEIFLKDIILTDITCPGCKKACKRIKVLFNFFAYVRTKKMEKEPMFYELECRQKEIEDMIDKKAEFTAKIGSVINERENKSELIKKLKKEIEDMKSAIEKDAKISRELEKSVIHVTEKQQEELQKSNDLKAKARKLLNITKNLQNKIVKSPEEYMNRSKVLKKQLEDKMEERHILQDCINRKKSQIQNNESAETEVKNSQNKMMGFGQTMKKLKEIILQINKTQKQINDLKEEIILLENKRKSSINDEVATTDTVDLEKSQRLLLELDHSHDEKQREYDSLKVKLEKLKGEQRKVEDLIQKEMKNISTAENEYLESLSNIKNMFVDELSEEIHLRTALKQT